MKKLGEDYKKIVEKRREKAILKKQAQLAQPIVDLD